MSASEDLQSAVQPAASEALEGFPLSPLQTRAWRRHAERPENTVVGVRLHAPADPVATLERLRRALDGEAQLRVAYRTMPGMSLPVQVLDGRAADLLVERLPGDGDWAGRFARESARLAASPLGGEGQPVLALGLLLDAAGETLQGLLLAAPAFVVDAASLVALLRRGLGRPARRARTRETRRCCSSISPSGPTRRWPAKTAKAPAVTGESRRPLRRRVRWRWRTTWAKASGRRGACCRARCSNAWQPTACRRRPPCWPGPRSPGSSRATRASRWKWRDWSRGACSTSSPSWPDRSPGSRRCAWRMSARAASASGSTPSRRRSSPRRRQRPCAIPCPRLAARRVGLRLAGGRTGWRRGGRAGLPSAAAGRVPRVAGAAPRRRPAGQPAGPPRP